MHLTPQVAFTNKSTNAGKFLRPYQRSIDPSNNAPNVVNNVEHGPSNNSFR